MDRIGEKKWYEKKGCTYTVLYVAGKRPGDLRDVWMCVTLCEKGSDNQWDRDGNIFRFYWTGSDGYIDVLPGNKERVRNGVTTIVRFSSVYSKRVKRRQATGYSKIAVWTERRVKWEIENRTLLPSPPHDILPFIKSVPDTSSGSATLLPFRLLAMMMMHVETSSQYC